MSLKENCIPIEPILYERDFIDYDNQPLFRYKLKLFGIKDDCCNNLENICYTKNNEFLKCKICERLFTWTRERSKVKWWDSDWS